MKRSEQSEAYLYQRYWKVRTDILYDLAAAATAVDEQYIIQCDAARLPNALAELTDLHNRLKSLLVGLPVVE